MTRWEIRLPTFGETLAADRVGRAVGPEKLRRRASLRVVCGECDGRLVASVAYLRATERGDGLYPLVTQYQRSDQRWLFADRQKPPDHLVVDFGWLDLSVWVYGRCHSFEHQIPGAELLNVLPKPNKKPVTARVGHQRDEETGESHVIPRRSR